MIEFGQEEIDAIGRMVRSGKLFRYMEGGQCQTFEQQYGKYLDVKHVVMAASGSYALLAALTSLGIGPGDEVIVPAHTYMATATAVVAAGAIPVICDVDASLTLCPEALAARIGPRTRAVIPVHMWGHPCDMDAIMEIAAKRKLLVLEDACQGVGGSYHGRKLGSMGDAGAFSFNYFKNMTCGEGGAAVTNDATRAAVMSCAIDCCGFYWKGQDSDVQPFAANSARASELEGSAMNVQLAKIDGLLKAMRQRKAKMISLLPGDSPIHAVTPHCPAGECGTHLMLSLPTAEMATTLATALSAAVASNTGRHTFTFWDPILKRRGSYHPKMNPFSWPENAACRMEYSAELFARSLDILNRTVLVSVPTTNADEQIKTFATRIEQAMKQMPTVAA